MIKLNTSGINVWFFFVIKKILYVISGCDSKKCLKMNVHREAFCIKQIKGKSKIFIKKWNIYTYIFMWAT